MVPKARDERIQGAVVVRGNQNYQSRIALDQPSKRTLEQTRGDLFANLDKASDELKIEYGQNKNDLFYESQGLKPPVVKDNVPPPRPHETRTAAPTKDRERADSEHPWGQSLTPAKPRGLAGSVNLTQHLLRFASKHRTL